MAFGAKIVKNFFAPDTHMVFYGMRTIPWTLVIDLKSLIAVLPKTKELDFGLAMAQIHFARNYWQDAYRQGANKQELPPGLQFKMEGRFEDFRPWDFTDKVSLLRWIDKPGGVPGGAVPYKTARESHIIYDGEIILNVAYGDIWKDPTTYYHVLLHEMGHILGFGHTRYKEQEYGWSKQHGPPSVMNGLPEPLRQDPKWIGSQDVQLCFASYTYLAQYWDSSYLEPVEGF